LQSEKKSMYKRGSSAGKNAGRTGGSKAPAKRTTRTATEKTGDRNRSERGKFSEKPAGTRKPYGSKERTDEGSPSKSYNRTTPGERTYERKSPAGRTYGSRSSSGDKPLRRPASDERKSSSGYNTYEESGRGKAPRKTFNRTDSGDRKYADKRSSSYDRESGNDRPRSPRKTYDRADSGDRKYAEKRSSSYDRESGNDRPRSPRKTYDRADSGDRKYAEKRSSSYDRESGNERPRSPRKTYDRADSGDRKYADKRSSSYDRESGRDAGKAPRKTYERASGSRGAKKTDLFDKKKAQKEEKPTTTNIRLNRYIANAGICSRREADDLISAGVVTVNGQAVTEMGYQVKPTDEVRYNGQLLSREKKVYLLLNKPKDAITTFEDPEGRRTVMELFGKELGERVYPVGRLDRNTTGVLLFTNDGDVAQRLMHPKYEMTKVYKATLNKNLKGEDLWQLQNGVELEDGFIKPDGIAVPDAKNKNEVGIEIHSGKNRIIHRMFEHLGYKVDKLDRALYAGLTKGKLKRGEWRMLTEKEINTLKRLVKLS
jgi:23S rRNA pseudouridine2605 synthase